MAAATSSATIVPPTSASLFFLSRRRPWASGDSDRVRAAGQAKGPTAGNSAWPALPPLITGPVGENPSLSAIGASFSSGVANARIEEGVGQVHQEVDHDERERRDQREPLHLLVVAGDDRVDAEGAEPRHREQ